ncbi:MAG: restriction endonuclease [Nitrospinae bacterium]|nr:restriction endonuclease [Nitrospinota bacterium]
MKGESYEKLVKDIYEALGKLDGVKILGWGRSCKVPGNSGESHQIDVLTSHSAGMHMYKTAIECKDWERRKVGKDVITKLAFILKDSNVDKGVVVSKSGFTSGAKSLAKSENISLVELRQPVPKDWDGVIKDVHIEVNLCSPETYDYRFVQDVVEDENKLERLHVSDLDVQIHVPARKPITLHEMTNRVLNVIDPDEKNTDAAGFEWTEVSAQENEKEYVVQFPDGTTLSVAQKEGRGKIREIHFKARFNIFRTHINIYGEEYISMIMHYIFENRRLVISPDGAIHGAGPLG